MTIGDSTGLCINYTQGLVTKQHRLVHLHQQTRALGYQAPIFLTILECLVMFPEYTGSLGYQTLLFITRLVHLVIFAEYTGSSYNYMLG